MNLLYNSIKISASLHFFIIIVLYNEFKGGEMMVPRTSRKRKFRKKIYHKRFAKALAISMAISSISIGSGQLIKPTYGAYNSLNDLESTISSCIIFPNQVKDFRDAAVRIFEENKVGFDKVEADSKALELRLNNFSEKLDELLKEDSPNNNSYTMASLENTGPLEEFDILKNNLTSEINESSQRIKENEAKQQVWKDLDADLEKIKMDVLLFNEQLEDEIEKSSTSVNEILEIELKVKEARQLTENDCNYEYDFFPKILKELEETKKANEEIIEALNMKMGNLKLTTELIDDRGNEIISEIKNLDNDNERLTALINTNVEQINSIDIQIQELIIQQKEEAARKKAAEEALLQEDKVEVPVNGAEDAEVKEEGEKEETDGIDTHQLEEEKQEEKKYTNE